MNPTGLCMCGCGQPTGIAKYSDARYGWVKGQPKRYVNHHNRRGAKNPRPPRPDHELYRIECRGYDTPCWVWANKPGPQGYGYAHVDGRRIYAHNSGEWEAGEDRFERQQARWLTDMGDEVAS